MSADSLLTVREVAARVGLSTKAVRRAIERGELPASKLCSRVRIRPADLDAWIDGGRIAPNERPAFDAGAIKAPAANGLRALLPDDEVD